MPEENQGKIVEYDVDKMVDLFWALSNLASIEEHLEQTYVRTKNEIYSTMLDGIRQLRSKHLQTLAKNTESEGWCINKHLLAGFMRLTEMATKELYSKNIEKFNEYIEDAFTLYDTFFVIQKIPELEKNNGGDKN